MTVLNFNSASKIFGGRIAGTIWESLQEIVSVPLSLLVDELCV